MTFSSFLWTKLSICALAGLIVSQVAIVASSTVESKQSYQLSGFVMPSKNIYCAWMGEYGLRCEIRSRLNPLPPQPYRGYCEFDWGAGLRLPLLGKPEILCISDTIADNYPVLSYGKTWKNGGIECVSQRTGLTCRNRTGNGFFLSRERWKVF